MPPAPREPTISKRPRRSPIESAMAGSGAIIAVARASTGDRMRGVAYRFGGFVLDYDTRQLSKEGSEIHLPPKAFELLVTLIRNRPRAMSKAELQDALWPATYVEETNLA